MYVCMYVWMMYVWYVCMDDVCMYVWYVWMMYGMYG